MSVTLNSQFKHNLKLINFIISCVSASFCIVTSQAHLILNDQEQFRARPPPIIDSRLEQRSPSVVMVDLSNDLAYKVLHLHSILNRNNFAFSPTALMCVLVALYEGSAGRSSLEMRNSLLMPNDRDVIRVGYRDIHRRLRTYFFDEDNTLKGLSLNKENVTILSEYETILKFYGYDLGMDMLSSTVAPTTTASTDETTTATYFTTIHNVDEKTYTAHPIISTTLQPPPPPEVTTYETETAIASESSQPVSTTLQSEEEDATTPTPQESDEVVTLPNSELAPVEERSNLRKPKTNEKLISPQLKYLPVKLTQIRSTSSKRNRRHLFGLKDLDPSFFLTFIQPRPEFLHAPPPSITIEAVPPPPQIHLGRIAPAEAFQPLPPITHIEGAITLENAFHPDVEQGFLKPAMNSEIVDHIFYINSQEVIHTTFKVYNSVLYYRYFEHLKMSILELELDSTDYNLMILLPDFDVDLQAAASSLRLGPTLRVLRKQLKPRWVQAIIPDFKLQGTMFLTNDLQNLGICDIFEPNRADFRPMTDETGIYVKHIEQTINVNIRMRPINQLKSSYGPQTRPIQVSVNHPFMFFIIDRDLDVATMAGRVLNPLNVRIQ